MVLEARVVGGLRWHIRWLLVQWVVGWLVGMGGVDGGELRLRLVGLEQLLIRMSIRLLGVRVRQILRGRLKGLGILGVGRVGGEVGVWGELGQLRLWAGGAAGVVGTWGFLSGNWLRRRIHWLGMVIGHW